MDLNCERDFDNSRKIIEREKLKQNSYNKTNELSSSNSKLYVLSNSIIHYYDDDLRHKPLKTSKSSYYLSSYNSFNDDEESNTEEDYEDSSSNEKSSSNQHKSLRSEFDVNENEKLANRNKLSSLISKTNKKQKDGTDSKDNIKNLSQFLIKSRSRSSSPRASFKNRKSFNQKHRNQLERNFSQTNNNYNDQKNSFPASSFSSSSLSHNPDDQLHLLNNQVLANKVAEQYIKENYGLLSSSELKKKNEINSQSDVPEEEPTFNAFDLKSLRYSFNKVLKRRGGLWSFSPPATPNELSNCSLVTVKDRNRRKTNHDQIKISIQNDNTCAKLNDKASKGLNILELISESQKLYWCEVPLVIESGILDKLDSKQRQLQEANFELIASEASYLRSLNLLVKNFYMNTFFCDTNIIDSRKKEDLFSNILDVVKVSTDLFNELEYRWKESVLIETFCDTIYKFSLKKFQVYMKYCRFKKRQERTLKQLQDKPKFNGILRLLESDSKCQGLSLHSFLLLPVQRITRYPLLIEAVLNRTDRKSDSYQITQECLKSCNEVVNLCNFAAKQYEDYEELIPKLKFSNIKCFPMLSTPRWLINICETVKIKQEIQSTTIIGSFRSPNWSKSNSCLILLSDLIIVAKKKSDEIYIVIDFCNRNSIEIYDIQPIEENRININSKMWDNFKHLIKVVFLCNFASKKIEFYFNFNSDDEKTSWLTLALQNEKKKINKKHENLVDTFNLKFFQKLNSMSNSTSGLNKISGTGELRSANKKKQLKHLKSFDTKNSQEWSDAECTNEIFI